MAAVNSGSSSLTADSCAGCHRAHTAQGEYLLKAASVEALCISCHGNAGTLATTDVEYGVQWVPVNAANVRGGGGGTLLGALRDGGFRQARIGASQPMRILYQRGFEDSPVNSEPAISTRPKVPEGSSEAITSAHIDLQNPTPVGGLVMQGTMWGRALSGLGQASVSLECIDCHNPHGNSTYRILRPVPGADDPALGSATPRTIKQLYASNDTIVTNTQHALVAGDTITISGLSGADTTASGLTNGNFVVTSVVNGFTIKVAAALASTGSTTAFDITGDLAPGAAQLVRNGVAVADVPVDPDGNGSNPTKNYTIIQAKGSQGVNGTYLLYARDVVNALGGTGIAQNQATVNITAVAANGQITTSGAHGLAVGDRVAILGLSTNGIPDGTYTVSAVSFSGSFYLDKFALAGFGSISTPYVPGPQPVTLTTTIVGTPTVQRLGISGDYSNTGGDYFHRTVPWDPKINNPACDFTVSTGSETLASNNNAAACGVANDAPNGRPNAILQVGNALTGTAVLGQQAFNDQITTWCAQCHTRYYSNTNENIGNLAPISDLSVDGVSPPISAVSGADFTIGKLALPNNARYGGPGVGDGIQFSGLPGSGGTLAGVSNATTYYVVATGTGTFQVAATPGGAAITPTGTLGTGVTFLRVYQSSQSSWGYPRYLGGVIDPTYKYQHQTTTNRACTTCHVAHGSNATVTGQNGTTFALLVPYPDGSATSTSSRLLKVDNRGTCQMCHEPTNTLGAGTLLPGSATPVVP